MRAILEKLIADHLRRIGLEETLAFSVDRPNAKQHGDFSTNVAMVLAKKAKMPPCDLAHRLSDSLRIEQDYFDKIEVAGPGFINFYLTPNAYQRALVDLWESPQRLRPVTLGNGTRVLVEFVSANPTGPMHVGHGRNAVVGDCLARLLEATGFAVTREFYVNDHGVQIKTLGRSGAHYHSVLVDIHGYHVALPEDVYRGEYLEALVSKLKNQIDPIKDDPMAIGKLLATELLDQIKEELLRLGIVFDHYFSESSLYESGDIPKTLRTLQERGMTYEQDGALWFKTTDFGDDKDRVLIKKDNSYTYMTPDIAYHKNKFERDFDTYINVMGADHGGYVKRLKAAVAALGFNPEQLKFLLMQLVNLKRGAETVNMSKRTGDYVTLHEVIDEVGKDATRFFFMMRSHHATLDFDLELAKQKSADNPVFYIQYAHARMCSIFQKATEAGFPSPENIFDVDLSYLRLSEEMDLIKLLLTYPEMLAAAAKELEPHRVAFYLQELAKNFQQYYTRGKIDGRYRVLSSDRALTLAKLFLLRTLREVFRHGLTILGVSAPEKMFFEEDESSVDPS